MSEVDVINPSLKCKVTEKDKFSLLTCQKLYTKDHANILSNNSEDSCQDNLFLIEFSHCYMFVIIYV